MALLTALTCLRRLGLFEYDCLPACLSALTWLQLLALHSESWPIDDNADELSTELANLQNLTCLSLYSNGYRCIPPALAELPRLQHLCFDGGPFQGDDLQGLEVPEGAWLASIRWLGLPWEVLELAASVLCSAPRLEYLCVCVTCRAFPVGSTLPEHYPLWNLVATHPQLRCLAFNVPGPLCSFTGQPAVASAIAALRLSRPELCVRYFSLYYDFEAELLHADPIPDPES